MKNDELFDAIVTDRIRLRCVNRDDASVLVALMTPGVSRWLASWPADLSEAAVIATIVEARTAIVAQEALHFLIERRADQAAMGWIRVSRLTNRSRRGDLSYWLNETYHGQGYAIEAARAATAAAFDRLDLDSIEAGAQRENAASIAVMRRLGMELDEQRIVWAETRARDELCVFYSVTRERFMEPHIGLNPR